MVLFNQLDLGVITQERDIYDVRTADLHLYRRRQLTIWRSSNATTSDSHSILHGVLTRFHAHIQSRNGQHLPG